MCVLVYVYVVLHAQYSELILGYTEVFKCHSQLSINGKKTIWPCCRPNWERAKGREKEEKGKEGKEERDGKAEGGREWASELAIPG